MLVIGLVIVVLQPGEHLALLEELPFAILLEAVIEFLNHAADLGADLHLMGRHDVALGLQHDRAAGSGRRGGRCCGRRGNGRRIDRRRRRQRADAIRPVAEGGRGQQKNDA